MIAVVGRTSGHGRYGNIGNRQTVGRPPRPEDPAVARVAQAVSRASRGTTRRPLQRQNAFMISPENASLAREDTLSEGENKELAPQDTSENSHTTTIGR